MRVDLSLKLPLGARLPDLIWHPYILARPMGVDLSLKPPCGEIAGPHLALLFRCKSLHFGFPSGGGSKPQTPLRRVSDRLGV